MTGVIGRDQHGNLVQFEIPTQSVASGSISGVMDAVRVDISASQILNCHTSPVTLLPAPGNGKMVVFPFYFLEYNFLTTPFSSGSSLDMYWKDTTTGGITGGLFTTILGNSANMGLMCNATSQITATDNLVNQPIVFSANANPTLGDGSLRIILYYTILSGV